ncbi:muscarinic acetylcholine receptor M1-like [Diadema antillarum]|uniref:muscarinic acetylcholine receptor M1-like n=1 Tax=Diadema antillarum TaxID=105358 RepID=UPI003A83B433
MNSTEEATIESAGPVFGAKFVVTISLAAMTAAANVLILMAFATQKKLWTYTNYYIFNMTLADLLVGVAVMPVRSIIITYNDWPFGRVAGLLFMTLQNASLGVSVMGVVVIAGDRYVATMHPMTHYMRKSKRLAMKINVLTWVVPFAIWLCFNLLWDLVDPVLDRPITATGLPRPNYANTKAASWFTFCLRFVIPVLLIMTLYLRLYYEIKTRARERNSTIHRGEIKTVDSLGTHSQVLPDTQFDFNPGNSPDKSVQTESTAIPSISFQVDKHMINAEQSVTKTVTEGSNRPGRKTICIKDMKQPAPESARRQPTASKESSRESPSEGQKAMRTLTFIVLAFAISWTPLAINVVLYSTSKSFYARLNAVVKFTEVARWISFTNSLLNPVAYAISQPLIRESIVRLFCSRCRRTG